MNSKHDVDCGWAWVVLAAACLERFMGSIVFLSGMYYVAFLETFNQSPNLIAWCTALHFSMCSLIGPVASGVVSVLGVRWTTFLGAIMMVSGFFTSAFVTNSTWLLISYGIIAGGGSGFTYVSAFVVLGYSFDKYRNIAYAISCASVGLGTMVFASLIQWLIDEYSWRGSLIVTSGIMAHLFVIGFSYRNIDLNNNADDKSIYSSDILHNDKEGNSANICCYKNDTNKLNANTNLRLVDTTTENGECNTLSDKHIYSKSYTDIPSYNNELNKYIFKDFNVDISQSQPHMNSDIKPSVLCHAAVCDNNSENNSAKCFSRNDFLRLGTFSKGSCEVILQSSIYIDKLDKQNVPIQTLQNVDLATREDKSLSKARYLDKYRPLIHWKFCVFTCTVILYHFGIACTYVHYPIFLLSNEIPSNLISKLMSSIGIANIISRILTGCASNSNDVNLMILFMASGGLTGVFLCLAPVIGSNLYGQLIISIGLGVYSNCMPALMGPMVIELVGLHLLNVAYGIQLFLLAIGMIVGPPLVGIAYNFTGTYNWSMISAGLAYISGSLLMMFCH